ncbi:GIY-YIG nuclease family protein [Granulosicoccus antarcticus]|uniref:Bacteriophage T5 Orf172 DNA-binding domain-containing protein n=1 Tax=Granulosicoccus antarcticus IMCC3135 TaxID=1192854 RepID=A0A2Z2P673_9GAMM|nr:GIY-YIG nuclease family protein [Granulosicoccus antarcticus]ASJ75344.1 hypothetical protein IMCC3135_26445 [Granulosicoccus antarcticus IMCC3135]
MDSVEAVTSGYVYILEVKDIQLPVCKIGMTTRTPSKRCSEINKSSTGDFIWAVAHSVTVDDCRKLESLIHAKLSPLRQKGREFFSLNADDAYQAMISILDSQSEITRAELKDESIATSPNSAPSPKMEKASFKKIDSEYAELLQQFSSLLQVKGRPFGQLNRPMFGMSDGNQGVQWNLAVIPETGEVKLGVNLEGSEKTGKWLISPFILSEPDIEQVKALAEDKDSVHIRFTRDAWQGAARLDIVEEFLGGGEVRLAELDSTHWGAVLKEALTCLDEKNNFRKRKVGQTVTLKSDGRRVEKDISPHLTIWTPVSMDGDIEKNLKEKIRQMTPIYNWVVASCGL